MRNLFESHIDDIRISDIEAFLADAEEDEGVNWEAKGDGITALGKHDIRKAVCAFANGRVLGVVVVGAEYDKGPKEWRLPGLRKPLAIPLRRWLDQVIVDGLAPIPTHELRTFRASAGRGPVALIRVKPLNIKPAVTTSGGVYVRTMTQSIPLKDPALIADLFKEGEAAEERAEKLAERLMTTPADALAGRASLLTGYRICVCPVGGPDDLPARIFKQSFAEVALPGALKGAWQGRLMQRPYTRVTGDRVIAWIDWLDRDERVVAEVHKEGAIVVSGAPASSYDTSQAIQLLRGGLDRQRDVLQRLTELLEFTGPAFVVYSVFAAPKFATSQ